MNPRKPSIGRGPIGWLLLGALACLPSTAAAQASDCAVPQERGGLIRGDRVPTGCVLESNSEPTYSPLWRLEDRERLRRGEYGPYVTGGIPVFFSLTPTILVLDSSGKPIFGPPAMPGRATGLERRPRNIRGGNFGPILRPFGPVIRPFGRLERPNPPDR